MRHEQLEQRITLSASPANWQDLPISIGPAETQGTLDNAAYDLIGSSQQRQQFGLTGAGYSVAIIDTGLDYKNPAFAGRYLGGWDFVNNDADPLDDNGHGTHVAGIIGSADATHPGIDTGVGLIALKVLDASGSGTFGNVDLALQWVAQHQAQYHIAAVNMSLGAGNYVINSFTMLDGDFAKLEQEGVFIAAAAGNSYYPDNSQPGLAFPAVDSYVVSVGAVWAADYGQAKWANGAIDYSTAPDQIASFTQRDNQLSILAPGAFVTSTYLNDSFASMAGTSMASPMVAASAVLIRQALDSQHEPADQAAILKVMQDTGVSVTDTAHGQDNVTHSGLTFKRLDLLIAVSSIEASPDRQYVTHLYESILSREPDQSGLGYWSNRLANGMPRSVLVDAIWNSTEHLSAEVQADYQTILGRTAGADEVAYWVGQMRHGMANSAVQQAFYESDEFYRRQL